MDSGNRRQDGLLATLSHELRNPLTSLRSSLFVLQRATPGGEQARRMVAIMNRQVDLLTSIANDLLDVARVDRDKMFLRRSATDLCALGRCAADDNRALFEGRSLRLVLQVPDEPLSILADPARLAQSLGNLLHNAAKFTPAGGMVTLIVERGPGTALSRITVRDTGIGITPELLPHVFEPFVQGDDSLARSQGGLGLGLAVVKRLVELHGGSVAAASEGSGHGATFTIELPLHRAEIENPPVPGPPLHTRRRVLVIDDNPEAAESLRAMLESLGQVVETVNDAGLGIVRACELRPDIVFCDVSLPGRGGYAIARALRESPQLRGVVTVALTGYAESDERRRAAEAGFHDHLARPPSMERLEEVLTRAELHSV